MISTRETPALGVNATFFDKEIACEWLGIEKASAFLDLTPNALRIMVHRGKIKAHKLGRRLRFRLGDLRSALQKMRS